MAGQATASGLAWPGRGLAVAEPKSLFYCNKTMSLTSPGSAMATGRGLAAAGPRPVATADPGEIKIMALIQ